jgi:hypothetical protein
LIAPESLMKEGQKEKGYIQICEMKRNKIYTV